MALRDKIEDMIQKMFAKQMEKFLQKTGTSLTDAKVPVVGSDANGNPLFNASSIGSADLAKLSGANALDGTIADAISGLCVFIDVPDYTDLNNLYGTTGTETEQYMKNAHRWLNENRNNLKILPQRPYILKLRPNSNGIALYYTYADFNLYNGIFYLFYGGDLLYSGYNGGTWIFKQMA